MKSVKITRPGSIQVEDVPMLTPAIGEVIVSIAYSGICGSDVELRAGRRPAEFVSYPVVPGHEWSGTVAKVAEGGNSSLLGRRVVGKNNLGCGQCASCQADLPMFCAGGYREIGFTEDGAWAEQLRVPAANVYVLEDDVDLRSAACLEPAACVADAVRLAQLQPGQRAAVVGAGNLGLLAVQLLADLQLAELVVVEPDPERGSRAEEFGATKSCHPDETSASGFDVSIETAGCCDAAQSAVDLLGRAGHVILLGIPSGDDSLLVRDLVTKRIELSTIFGATSQGWEEAVSAFRSGRLDPGKLVTHEFPIDEAGTALDLLDSKVPGVGKVLLHP